jgi:hypothetical protein
MTCPPAPFGTGWPVVRRKDCRGEARHTIHQYTYCVVKFLAWCSPGSDSSVMNALFKGGIVSNKGHMHRPRDRTSQTFLVRISRLALGLSWFCTVYLAMLSLLPPWPPQFVWTRKRTLENSPWLFYIVFLPNIQLYINALYLVTNRLKSIMLMMHCTTSYLFCFLSLCLYSSVRDTLPRHQFV